MLLIVLFHSLCFYIGTWWYLCTDVVPLWKVIAYPSVKIGLTTFVFISGFLYGYMYFEKGKYRDVIGLCKVAKLEGEDGIKDQDYSLNPGRYVGVVIEDDGMTEEEFKEKMLSLNVEFQSLNNETMSLQKSISMET